MIDRVLSICFSMSLGFSIFLVDLLNRNNFLHSSFLVKLFGITLKESFEDFKIEPRIYENPVHSEIFKLLFYYLPNIESRGDFAMLLYSLNSDVLLGCFQKE